MTGESVAVPIAIAIAEAILVGLPEARDGGKIPDEIPALLAR